MKNFINISIVRYLNLFLLLFPLISQAQNASEIDELKRNSNYNDQNIYTDTAKIYNSEYDIVFGNLFNFYKKYISSQDASSCSFTPSCSEYALLAIKKQGIFIGIINFWDRYTRCNGLSPKQYSFDPVNRLLIDPVRDWNYAKK